MIETIIIGAVVAAVTGGVSSFATVKMLGVHITYLKSGQDRNEKSINLAHSRIDVIEREGVKHV